MDGLEARAGCLAGTLEKPLVKVENDTTIVVTGLPNPGARKINASYLITLVHLYKHLLAEGDRKGRNEYERKRKLQLPIENPHLKLFLSYTYQVKVLPDGTCELKIALLKNGACDACRRFDMKSEYKKVLDEEADSLMRESCAMIAHDLQAYLEQEYARAIRDDEEPDYWGFDGARTVKTS